MSPAIPAAELTAIARGVGFDLVGFAPAEPIDPKVLLEWLEAGHHADLDWMANHVAERLDVGTLFPGARSVIALACNYWQTDEHSPIARYARGRDYHHSLRDKLRNLRRGIRARWPEVRDYGSVDSNPVMEKLWAVRAGLGSIGKNSCLITPEFGSWVVLAVMILNTDIEGVHSSVPVSDVCGKCRSCIDACPTGAILEGKVIDARRCLSYQTIENEGPVPEELRGTMNEIVFGCDVCQDVCPCNFTPVLGAPRFSVRPVSSMSVRALASLSPERWAEFAPGTPLARAGYDGVRRNAAYALGAAGDEGAIPILETLRDDPSELVREAARWALARLTS